jgi:hypothetical protein
VATSVSPTWPGRGALRLRDRQRLVDEVAELATDEADRAEAAEVSAIMEDLRAPG